MEGAPKRRDALKVGPYLPWAYNDNAVPSLSSFCIRKSPQLQSSQMQELLVNTATGVSGSVIMLKCSHSQVKHHHSWAPDDDMAIVIM